MARQLTGHSNREIARLLGVHRETVGKYVSQEADVDLIPAKPDHRLRPLETEDNNEENQRITSRKLAGMNPITNGRFKPINDNQAIRVI